MHTKSSLSHLTVIIASFWLASLASASTTIVSIADATSSASNQPTDLLFHVERTGDLGYDTIVRYQTIDGTAIAGTDYTAASGTITIPAGSSSATIPVTLNPATGALMDRTFQLVVDSAVGIGPTPVFSSRAISPVGAGARGVAIADVNSDGRPDVLSVNTGDSTVSVLLNTTPAGADTAVYANQVTFAVDQKPLAIAIADINGDGRPDVLTTHLYSATISVLLNTTQPGSSTPSFAAAQSFTVGTFDTRSIDVADFNGDGIPDLCVTYDVTDPDASVAVLLNTTSPGASAPTFAPAQNFAAGASPWAIRASDVNGDGKPDLVVSDSGHQQVWVRLNTTVSGATTFAFGPAQSFSTGMTPHALATADIDGDGKQDLVVANDGDNSVSLLRNTTAAGASVASFAQQQIFPVPAHPVNLIARDLNGDGRIDIAVADNTSSSVSLLPNTTAPGATKFSFATPVQFAAGDYPASIASADINADGIPDLVISSDVIGTVSTLLNQTPLGLVAPDFAARRTFPVGSQPMYAAGADFNADGKLDLVVANYNDYSVSVLFNTIAPGAVEPDFAAQQTFATDQYPVQLETPDINGDGRLDVVTANFNGTVSVLLNTTTAGASTPSFAAQQSFSTGTGNANSVAVADFNRDGKPDLAVADNGMLNVNVLLNTTPAGAATASFATSQAFPVGWPFFVTTADVNLDGAADLVVANLPNGTISVLLNATAPGAATATFLAPQDFSVGASPRSITVVDVNGDGKLDLLVANRDDGTLSPLLNITVPGATSASFLTGAPIPAGANTYADRAVDANGDGKPDIVATNQNGTTATLLLNMTAAGTFAPIFSAQSMPIGQYPYSATTTDVNGDGHPDLIVPNEIDATVSVLLNTQYRVVLTGSPATGTILGDLIFASGFE